VIEQTTSHASRPAGRVTPLYDLHRAVGARMGPFAGYEMPLHYPAGTIKEHLQTRSAAGLFDVSHMGQIAIRPRSGKLADAARALETVVAVDVLGLGAGRQRYALFTNDDGGVLDDLMIANLGDRFFLVVNASRKDADEAHLRDRLSAICAIDRLDDRALLALQGPQAETVLRKFAGEIVDMRFMEVREISILGEPCIVSRSGYTGEDGFEISVPSNGAERLALRLLDEAAVAPVGLAARDTLRLEAGLCLYGADLDVTTTPVEAGLEWAIQKSRRAGGAREGGFPGAEIILRQLRGGPPRRRLGLRPEGKAPIRAGAPIFAHEAGATTIGSVTSGGFGPTVNGPIAMGYLAVEHAVEGAAVFTELRGKRVPMRVTALPFIRPNYKRS